MVQLSHPYMTAGKTIALTIQAFVGKVTSLLFKTLARFVIAFFPRSKRLLISWLQSLSAVKICHCFHFLPHLFAMKQWDWMPWSQFFLMLSFKPALSLSYFTLSSCSLSAVRMLSSAYLTLLIFLPAILILAYDSSNPAFCMMYSAYKLNKQGDNIQPCTPFPGKTQSVVLCLVLTIAS